MTTKKEVTKAEPTSLVALTTVTKDLFTTSGAMTDLLSVIDVECKDMVFDVSTAKGRAECKAFCTRITKGKSAIEDFGAAYSKEVKSLPQIIDGSRKLAKDHLAELKNYVRLPLTNWENEKKEKDAQKIREAEQAKVDTDHEVALILYENWLREQNELIAAEQEKQKAADLEAKQKLIAEAQQQAIHDKEMAEFNQKQAEQEAAAAKTRAIEAEKAQVAQKIQADKNAEKYAKEKEEQRIKYENDQARQHQERKEYEEQQEVIAAQQLVESSLSHLRDMRLAISRCIDNEEVDHLARRAGALLKEIEKHPHDPSVVDAIKKEIFNSGKQKREELAKEAEIQSVNISFPDEETCKLIMNDLIDCAINRGLEYQKVENTLVLSKPAVVAAENNQWGLS